MTKFFSQTAITLGIFLTVVSSSAAAEIPPNILFIMSDDQSRDFVGAYVVHTNFDPTYTNGICYMDAGQGLEAEEPPLPDATPAVEEEPPLPQ